MPVCRDQLEPRKLLEIRTYCDLQGHAGIMNPKLKGFWNGCR